MLHSTRNDLKSNTKAAVISLLNAHLADAIDLGSMTKQAHWNLRGRQFIAVHEMLDQFRTEIDGHVDTMAERVVQIDLVSIEDHVAALEQRFGDLANSIRAAIDAADEAGDAGSADILTAFSRSLDKALWFLEAHETDKA